MGDFVDLGSFWLSTSPQGSERWHELRKGRLTMSVLSQAIGHETRWGTPLQVALGIAGKEIKQTTPAMEHGTKMEPIARDWYSKSRNVTVEEVGIAIPKNEPRIGASLDGIIGSDGAIEIKCPKIMYRDLEHHIEALSRGVEFPRFYHDHLKTSHYDQIQGQLFVTGREYCDYICFASDSGKVFVDRVEFNPQYWSEIWPKIQYFLDEILDPILDSKPIMPSD